MRRKYFFFSGNKTCQPCEPLCDNCIDSATKCTSCLYSGNGYFEDLTNNICSCSNLYEFDSLLSICKLAIADCIFISDSGCTHCAGFYSINSSCKPCYVDPLSRLSETFLYSQSDGKLSYKQNNTQLAIGHSGEANNICSILSATRPIIPTGVYTVSKIQCFIESYNFTRVLKLEPTVRYLTDQKYDSLYTDLYIYPSEEEAQNIKDIPNIKGIAFTEDIRQLLTVGDIIGVENSADLDLITSCPTVSPPSVGEIDATVNDQTNVITADFKGWGEIEAMNDKFIYSGCIEIIPNYCSHICAGSDIRADGIQCNSGNEWKIGYFGTEGTYPIRFMAKYANTSLLALYSKLKKDVTFNKLSNEEVQLRLIQGIVNITNLNMLVQTSQISIVPVFKLISKLNLSNKRTLSTQSDCSCSNKGRCKTVNKVPICKCQEGYYGRACELSTEVYMTFKNYSETVSYSIESMIQNSVQLSLNSIFDSFAIVSICPIASLSNDVRSSTLSSILIALEKANLDELDIEHLNFIVNNLMSMIEEDAYYNSIQRVKANYKYYIHQISLIESIYKVLMAKKVQYGYFIGSNEAITLGSQSLNYVSNTNHDSLSSNVSYSLNQTISYLLSIEYPNKLVNAFPTPSGYFVGSSALGFSLYSNSNTDTDTQIEITFSSKIIKTANRLLSKWKVSCGCYDDKSAKLNTSVCHKVMISGSVFKYSCSANLSPCYLVYKFSPSVILIIAISLLIAAGIIVGVGLWRIIKSRRLRNTKTMADKVTCIN